MWLDTVVVTWNSTGGVIEENLFLEIVGSSLYRSVTIVLGLKALVCIGIGLHMGIRI